MTELIKEQLLIILYMCMCGLCSGLILDTYKLFRERFFSKKKAAGRIISIFSVITIAFVIEEYSLYCQNGKMTCLGTASFFIGLWLWYKNFYDIISLGEKDE